MYGYYIAICFKIYIYQTLITSSTHLLAVQDYWMVEYEGYWMLLENLNKVLKQHIAYGVVKFWQQDCTKVTRMLPETS